MATLQIIPIFITTVCCILVFSVTIWNQWEISSDNSSRLLGSVWAFRGLWESCMQQQSGTYQCETLGMEALNRYPTLLVLRLLMCTAIAFSCISLVCQIVVAAILRSASVDSHKTIRILTTGSAILVCLSGLLIITAVSWSTCDTIYRYNDPKSSDNLVKLELGAAIYLGYVTGLLHLIATACCLCCQPPRYHDPIGGSGGGMQFRYSVGAAHHNTKPPPLPAAYPEYV